MTTPSARALPALLALAACASEAGTTCDDRTPLTELVVEVSGVPGEADFVVFSGTDVVISAPLSGMSLTLPLPETPPAPAETRLPLGLLDGAGQVLGLSGDWLVWSEGPGDPDDPFTTLHGWNLLHSEMSAGSARSSDCTATVEASLVPFPFATFQGTLAEAETTGRRIALVSAVALGGGAVAEAAVADVPAAPAWSITVESDPPTDHLAAFERSNDYGGSAEELVAWESLVLYTDSDGSESWSPGDSDVRQACSGSGEELGAAWVAAATTPDAASAAIGVGLGTGWTATVGTRRAELTTVADVSFSSECD